MSESYHSVAIVGAGLSGLYAARLLKAQFPDVVLLEAQDRVGGRIKQVHGMAPWPVEAGPEFVHGRNSHVVRFAESALGVTFGEKEWPDWWWFGPEAPPPAPQQQTAQAQQQQQQQQQPAVGLVADADVDDEIDQVHELFGECGSQPLPPPGRDVSAAEWMRARGCSPRQLAVAEACYANDFGCSLRQLGMRETVLENRCWDSGETYLLMDRSMGAIPEALAVGANVRTNWIVRRIEYGSGNGGGGGRAGGGVTVRAADGRVVRCRAVLVTVPVTILQAGAIEFSPPLPPPKAAALGRVRMGNAVKVVCSFANRFWREDMYDVVCPGSFVPEFWMLRYPTTDPGAGTPHCVVGFLAGERADEASALAAAEGEGALVRRFLAQLDRIFGGRPEAGGAATPATSSLVKARVVDWSKEPFVRGAYTYPSLGAEEGDRAALAAPVAGAVFFAGEATNEAINPCMQGAMQTAERAAAQIAAALAGPASKL